MKRNFLTLVILVHTGLQCLYAQNWQPVGRGVGLDFTAVRCLFADSLTNRLYIGGNFAQAYGYTDTIEVNGIAYWDGSNWFPLGLGDTSCFDTGCSNSVLSIAKYSSDIYACGNFLSMGGASNTKQLARWNGSNWSAVNGVAFPYSGGPWTLKELNNQLYVLGYYDSIAGISANSIASWNGASFNNVNNLPSNNSSGGNNTLYAMDSLQGELYVAGDFQNLSLTTMSDIVRWDGSQWQPLQNGIVGGADWVNDMIVYNNELYVCGNINKADGNIGDGVLVWNGSSWREFSPDVYFGGQIFDLNVIDNVLYIAGAFTFTGDTTEYGLSKYDGTTFSAFGGAYNWAYHVEGLNGNLYVATDKIIGSDTVNYIAQWMGGNSVDSSITVLTNISRVLNDDNQLKSYPNPASNQLRIEFELTETNNALVEIQNVLGQTVKTISNIDLTKGINRIDIDLSKFERGLYFIQLQSSNQRISKKFIKH